MADDISIGSRLERPRKDLTDVKDTRSKIVVDELHSGRSSLFEAGRSPLTDLDHRSTSREMVRTRARKRAAGLIVGEIFRYLFAAASSRELKNIAVVIKKTEPPTPPPPPLAPRGGEGVSEARLEATRGVVCTVGGGKVSEKRAHDNAAPPSCPPHRLPSAASSFSTSTLKASFLSAWSFSTTLLAEARRPQGWGCRGLIKNSDEFLEDVGLLSRFSRAPELPLALPRSPRPSRFIHSFFPFLFLSSPLPSFLLRVFRDVHASFIFPANRPATRPTTRFLLVPVAERARSSVFRLSALSPTDNGDPTILFRFSQGTLLPG